MSKIEWDRHSILAAVRRKGGTLARLSREAGEPEVTCSTALRQGYPKGERIISDFLGVPVEDLWPERYPSTLNTRKSSAANAPEQSQKRRASADIGVAA